MSTERKDKQLSRKDFMKGVGKSVAGVALLGGVGGLLTACADQPSATVQPQAGGTDKPQWPYTYVKLDPDKVEQRAYDAYMSGHG